MEEIKEQKLTKWSLDPAHSEVYFKVKHMVISTVTGEFTEFESSIESSVQDFSDAKFSFVAEVGSINTKIADRDNHLKSPDFFDQANHPQIKFESTTGIQEGKIKGILTIKGESKEVVLDADFGGIAKDPWGNEKAGFEISGKINRKDFGLTWNQITEAGGLMVSEDVKLQINLEFAKQN